MEEVRIKCESGEEKQEVLEEQLREALSRVQDLESQKVTDQSQHEMEIKQLRETYDGKCNENQQVSFMVHTS